MKSGGAKMVPERILIREEKSAQYFEIFKNFTADQKRGKKKGGEERKRVEVKANEIISLDLHTNAWPIKLTCCSHLKTEKEKEKKEKKERKKGNV